MGKWVPLVLPPSSFVQGTGDPRILCSPTPQALAGSSPASVQQPLLGSEVKSGSSILHHPSPSLQQYLLVPLDSLNMIFSLS